MTLEIIGDASADVTPYLLLSSSGDKPGKCIVLSKDLPVSCGNNTMPECENDWKCDGNKKCCDGLCTKRCFIPLGVWALVNIWGP
ncbi:antileukoproteinase-like [Pseudophryne corroboree]|uniref:antileukoproteinase-like n=1 Tax=Pseudophryne corroboree TaxID=495146 RepID=UPI003081C590